MAYEDLSPLGQTQVDIIRDTVPRLQVMKRKERAKEFQALCESLGLVPPLSPDGWELRALLWADVNWLDDGGDHE